jgi:iron-sulfur cluster repair protein YtfE (RIC family)
MSEPIDTRAMNCVHTFFRREFRLAPAAVRAAGDTRRIRVVSDHLAFLTASLHHHHLAEDEHLWPKLLDRVPDELAPIVHLKEAQHERVGELLHEIERVRAAWRSEADRDELARLLDRLYVSLCEHLDAEEERLLPIAARNITLEEWHQFGEAAIKSLRKPDLPLVLGMIQYEGDPEVVAEMVRDAPRILQLVIPPLSRRAFRKHALAVHGTATP